MKVKTKCLSALLIVFLFVGCLIPAPVSYAASAPEEVTLIGTIVHTRDYYNINGDVVYYGFFPVTLTTVNIGGKPVELYECGVGVAPEFGTDTNLEPYVGTIKQYTGRLGKSSTKPYTYSFGITSVSDVTGPVGNDGVAFNAYLTSLGYDTTAGLSVDPGYFPYTSGGRVKTADGFCDYHCFTTDGITGQVTVNVMKDDLTYEFGAVQVGMGLAKAQYVAKLTAGYANGTVKKSTLQGFLPQ